MQILRHVLKCEICNMAYVEFQMILPDFHKPFMCMQIIGYALEIQTQQHDTLQSPIAPVTHWTSSQLSSLSQSNVNLGYID